MYHSDRHPAVRCLSLLFVLAFLLSIAPAGRSLADGSFSYTDAQDARLKALDCLMICGFSSDNQATACDPQLTSVEQNGLEVGREAVDILIGLVEGTLPTDHAQKRIVRTRLVIRGTTR